ncbi:MAG: HAD family phosphatase [Lachnospiraceae bacterium]|nr:HAD family phosphatase [Lachnospiraceae bacterium]
MKAIIFDMDGVIFDSEQAIFNEWQELSKKYGFENVEIPLMKCVGVNSKMTRQIFMDFYGEDFPYDKYCMEQSEAYHRKYDNGKLPMKKGVVELLTALKENEYKIAIASSTRTEVVKNQIEAAGLMKYFEVIIGGDMVEKSKPSPDIFLKAANELGGAPEHTYVVEDSYNGIRAAYSAGMIPIMVPDMLKPDDEMEEKARYIKADLLEVKDLLCHT